MTELEAKKLVAVLTAFWPDARWPSETTDAYAQALLDLDYRVAEAAVRQLYEQNKWRPALSEIRAAAVSVQLGPKRGGVDAWGDVVHAMRYVGAYGRPRFSDPLVAYVVERMGWKNLCCSDTPEGVDRARFCEFYESLRDDEHKRLQLSRQEPMLAGAPPRLLQLIQGIGKGGNGAA